jgi:hypothetical protein
MLFLRGNRPRGRGGAPFGAGRLLIATDKFFGSKIELCIQLCIRFGVNWAKEVRLCFTNRGYFTDQ